MHRNSIGRRIALIGAATAGVIALLAGCAGTATSGDAATSSGSDTLTLALSGKPTSFDPAQMISAGDGIWRWKAVFDTLLRCDGAGEIQPAAASEWELSEDATTLTMSIRPGMTFSDGSPITAADAVASITHMQEGGGSDAGRVAGVEVTAPDDMTVVLTSPTPNGQLPMFMCFAPGIVASADQLENTDIETAPISSGPYELDVEKTTTGSVYTYTKRDDYWEADQYPYENLVLTVMEEPTARVNALATGQIQGTMLDQSTAAQAEGAGKYVLKTLNSWVGMMLVDREGAIAEPFKDVRVRQAINMAFDRDAIAAGLFGGEAEPTGQIFGREAAAYVPELNDRYPYDPEGARALLAEAGYPDGFELTLPNQDVSPYMPMVVQQLADIGITVNEEPLTDPTIMSRLLAPEFAGFVTQQTPAGPLFDVMGHIDVNAIYNPLHSTTPELAELIASVQSAQGEEAVEGFTAINTYVVDNAWFAPWVNVNSYFGLATEELAPESSDQFHVIVELRDFR